MIHYLKCSRRSHVTGRLIATAISALQGRKCVYCNKDRPRHPERRHVRWGSTALTSDNGINLRSGVRVASNKLFALVQLHAKGVPVPKMFAPETFVAVTPERRIFRKRFRQNANDLPYFVEPEIPPDVERVAAYDYALQHIASDHEYRVHVFGGRPIRILEKIPADGFEPSADVRSISNGWDTAIRENEPCENLIDTAVGAVNELGLHFGVVDVIHGNDGKLYVLEVNTAPGMGPGGAMLYARCFVEWDQANPEG